MSARSPKAVAARFALIAAAAIFAGAAAAAEPLPAPQGEVILTVTGDIEVENGDGAARFDRAMLEALGVVAVRTSTNWTSGPVEFAGPPLRALLSRLGVRDGRLRAAAINAYAVDVPVSDAVEGGPILALTLDGAPMTVRSKGPIWLIYPYDSDPRWQTEEIYARSIWQLDKIDVSR